MGASGDRSQQEGLFPNRARTATDAEGVWGSWRQCHNLARTRPVPVLQPEQISLLARSDWDTSATLERHSFWGPLSLAGFSFFVSAIVHCMPGVGEDEDIVIAAA